jgi:2-aminoadipate transaminase
MHRVLRVVCSPRKPQHAFVMSTSVKSGSRPYATGSAASASSSSSSPLIDFLRGHPHRRHLPAELLAPSSVDLTATLAEDPVTHLCYQPSAGAMHMRESICALLREALAHLPAERLPTTENIVVVPGASFAFHHISHLLLRQPRSWWDAYFQAAPTSSASAPAHAPASAPSSAPCTLPTSPTATAAPAPSTETPPDVVVVEDPTYFLATPIFRENGLQVRAVPVDEHGLQVDELQRLLESGECRVRFVYTIPIHHNPAGVTLSEERRRRLISLSKRHGFFVVADEVYQLLSYVPAHTLPPPLALFDRHAPHTVCSVGSFSKILAPGMRLGWIQAGTPLASLLLRASYLESGGALVNSHACSMLSTLIRSGRFQAHLRFLCAEYTAATALMCEALERAFPPHLSTTLVHFRRPHGGYFVWLRLHPAVCVRTLQFHMKALGVHALRGELCGARSTQYLRLCIVWLEPELVEEGVRRLAEAVRRAAAQCEVIAEGTQVR